MTQLPQTVSPALPAGYSLQEYTLESILGTGGFGITYLAHDNHLHHKVAIKEFFPASLAVRDHGTDAVGIRSPDCEPEFMWGKTRYAQEAQTLACFNHPSIVRVYRYFEANCTSYMVMAFEEGKSLAEFLGGDVSMWNEARIMALVTPLLSGLAEVHKAGFLHRDIKPENILLRSKDHSPVLLDFGSARSVMTNHAMTAMVSPGYGPLEQYSSDHGDQGPWTDIYALAAVMYRIVAGQVPVPAPNRLIKDSLLPAVFAGAGHYGKPFLTAIDQALSIDEAKRPQNVTAWLARLTAPAAPQQAGTPAPVQPQCSEPPRAPRVVAAADRREGVRTGAPRPTLTMPPASTAKAGEPRPSAARRFMVAAASVLGVLVVVAGGVLATDWGYLRMAYFVYTTGTETRNPDMTYAFLCPTYFKSEMSIKDINASWANPDGPVITERFQGMTKESSSRATVLSAVTIDGAAAAVVPQTWSRNGFFWCRDVVVDFRAQKAKVKRGRPILG